MQICEVLHIGSLYSCFLVEKYLLEKKAGKFKVRTEDSRQTARFNVGELEKGGWIRKSLEYTL